MESLGTLTANVLAAIDAEVHGFAQAGFEALTDPVSDLMGMMLILGIAHALYSLTVTGAGGNFIQLAIRYAMVWGVATSWSFFAPVFYNVVTGTPDDILGIVVDATGLETGPSGGVAALISGFLDTGVKIGDQLIENSGIRTLAIALVGIIILFMMLVVAAGVILVGGVSKIGIGLLTAVAPLFIAMLIFRGTKGFFDGWLRLIVSFAITYLMAMLALGFLLFLAEDILLDYESRSTIAAVGETVEFLLIVILTLFLLRQIPSFGAAIAGSAAIGIDGLAAMDRGMNRAHGLRGDGRERFIWKNRAESRKAAAQWVGRKPGQIADGVRALTGNRTSPVHEARANAANAAQRIAPGREPTTPMASATYGAASRAKGAAFNRFIPDPDGYGAQPGDDGYDLMTRRGRE